MKIITTIVEKITGISGLKSTIKQAKEQAAEATREAQEAQEKAALAKMTPKERATHMNEPWVAVLETKVDKDNPRNGFFELDWNKQFIEFLIESGYGFESDPEEEIVDRWFRDLASTILSDEGVDPHRGAGYINIHQISNNHYEVA